MIKNIKIIGVVCEFNPFHLGHMHLISKMKENGLVICVMSGNFVQRGDVAILDKWSRAKTALACGADLVIELPIPFATANAELFAKGSVEILNSLGIVDELHFGSECGDTSILEKIVNILYSDKYSNLLKDKLTHGITFAKARENVVAELFGENYRDELKGSNNNLAIEYIKALRELKSDIKPVTIKRIGTDHDQIGDTPVVSAMQIRNMIRENDFNFAEKLPKESFLEIEKSIKGNSCPSTIQNLERAILCKLRTMSKEQLESLPDISEGLHNKLYKAIRNANTLDELIELTKSKRYTHARIRRLILHAFLGVDKSLQQNQYIRILGMSENGKNIIKNCKKDLPIIGKSNDVKKLNLDAQRLFDFESICDDIYELAKPKPCVCGSNLSNKIIII